MPGFPLLSTHMKLGHRLDYRHPFRFEYGLHAKVPGMAGDSRLPPCPQILQSGWPKSAARCRSRRSPGPGEPEAGKRAVPGRSTATERLAKEQGRDPILGDAFLRARRAPCLAAAIFQSLHWQPVAVSLPIPPRPNLKDEFNIYLLAPELREAGEGRAANSARNQHAHPPRHGAVPLMNECGGRAGASPHLSSRCMLDRPLCAPGTMGSG